MATGSARVELREQDTEENPDPAAGLLRKRHDGFVFKWGSKISLILELNSANDSRATRHTGMDRTTVANKISLILELTRAYCMCAAWHTGMDGVKTQRHVPLPHKTFGYKEGGQSL